MVRVNRDSVGCRVFERVVERRGSDDGRRWSQVLAECSNKADICGSIERPVDPAPVVCEFGVGKDVQLRSSEMPAVQSNQDCAGTLYCVLRIRPGSEESVDVFD